MRRPRPLPEAAAARAIFEGERLGVLLEGEAAHAAAVAGRARLRRRRGRLLDAQLPAVVDVADLGLRRAAAQERVDRGGDAVVDGHALAVLELDEHVESGRRATFEHGLLRAATPGLFVAQRDAFDAPDEIGQGRIDQQVLKTVAVRGAHELHAALRDGARGGGRWCARRRLPARGRSRR